MVSITLWNYGTESAAIKCEQYLEILVFLNLAVKLFWDAYTEKSTVFRCVHKKSWTTRLEKTGIVGYYFTISDHSIFIS